MYIKVRADGSTVFPYSLSDFRAESPRTSYPADVPEELLNGSGVFAVDVSSIPEFDQLTQELTWTVVQSSSTRWTKQWVAKNLSAGEAGRRVRSYREHLLSETDWTALSDVSMSEEMRSYRQALRDIPDQEGFPHSVVWPVTP